MRKRHREDASGEASAEEMSEIPDYVLDSEDDASGGRGPGGACALGRSQVPCTSATGLRPWCLVMLYGAGQRMP